MNRTRIGRIGIGVCVFVVVMVMAAGSEATLSVFEGGYVIPDASHRGRIAMKSSGQPVVMVGVLSGYYQYYVYQHPGSGGGSFSYLSGSGARSDAWMSGGSSSADIAVDGSDGVHTVVGNPSKSPQYCDPTGGRSYVGGEVWHVSPAADAGHVRIAANNDGLHIGYHPRINLGGGDDWKAHVHVVSNSGSGWSSPQELDNGGNGAMGPALSASANELYLWTLARDDLHMNGPRYQQVDDGDDFNSVGLGGWQVDSGYDATGNMYRYDNYNLRVSPYWNGSAMNLATVEGGYSTNTGAVALYLDTLGSATPVDVYNDGASGDPRLATANSTALACVGGMNYVFFTAQDPTGSDTELFMQAVSQSGTLVGSLQQLTFDDFNQYELDAAAYGDALDPHVYVTYQTSVGTGGDADLRVGWMHLVPEPTILCLLLLGGVGLVRRRK